ncbi:hypothetical protein SKTS_35760 [Sulfurimicrobium lacus]|uniref:GGDEF domain-containing protein n=1 Tax=Sulfurimicrobium lacus TaxID=2715678 RepID=A0A6F8VH62_9PROT|nr:EAL domain-containing protein [Sulfurimicrobium lacus]BCB28690.1 hypothetical protein SKTS_35760 [Sulfurimicrobium lacus]
MKKAFLSLRAKLVLITVIIEVLMLALLVSNNNRLTQDSLMEQAQLRLREYGLLFNTALAPSLVAKDYSTLQEILGESRKNNGIAYLILTDTTGRVIAADGWSPGEALPKLDRDLAVSVREAHQIFDTELPIHIAGQTYGTLRYGIDTRFMQEAQSRLLQQSLLIAGVALLLSVVLLTAAGLWLTRHLGRLSAASRAVAEGNFDISLQIDSRDEIGQLTQPFNTMARAVSARISELETSQEMQRRYLNQAQEEHARLISLLSAMNFGVLFVNQDETVMYYNPAFVRIWMIPERNDLIGRPVAEVLRHSANMLAQPDHFSKHFLQVVTAREVSDTFEIGLADGRTVTQMSYPVHDPKNRFIGRLWVYEDITRERQTAEQLIYLAERDSLTGLYNRHRFQDELARALSEAERRDFQVALLFFDLDEFKYVNDTFGHRAGDAMLIRVAGEVGTIVRNNELLSRLGGDEFAVLVSDVDIAQAEALAERIVRAIAHIPLRFDGHNLRLTTSLGIAFYPAHASTAEELIAHADSAMYQAKQAGKNTWRTYRPELDDSLTMVRHLSWNERISRALEQDPLLLHFQGVYHAQTGKLAHLEALVRMIDTENPDQLIMPGHFISHAEKSGKIRDIDRWVIGATIAMLASSTKVPPIAVNISGRSFDDPTLPQYISEQLTRRGVAPQRLLVELTETSAVTDLHDAQRFIESLRQTGCPVCLDDFGTGFSSFAYLKHLNADILKIDGLFIRNLTNDHDNQVFVKAIVDVARGMKKTTVAEFVENEDILEMLRRFGVDLVQGYHLDMPRADHPALSAAGE